MANDYKSPWLKDAEEKNDLPDGIRRPADYVEPKKTAPKRDLEREKAEWERTPESLRKAQAVSDLNAFGLRDAIDKNVRMLSEKEIAEERDTEKEKRAAMLKPKEQKEQKKEDSKDVPVKEKQAEQHTSQTSQSTVDKSSTSHQSNSGGQFVNFTEEEENKFREYVKNDEERYLQYYIKMGTPVSENLKSFFKSYYGQDMPQELAEDLKLEELDRKAEKIAKSVGVECGYDKARIEGEVSKDPFLSTKDPAQLSPEELAESRKRLDSIFTDDKSPQIHNFYQLLMAVAVNVFRQLGQLSQQNQQQEQAQTPKEQTQQIPTSEEQTEMRARRHDINAQMESALRSAPAMASAAYTNEMDRQQQQQQGEGMSMGR